MSVSRITSLQNPRIKNLVKLRESSHRKRQKLFPIEGYRELSRAIGRDWPMASVFYCDDYFSDESSFDLLERIEQRGIELVSLSPEAFEKVSYRENPDGWLGVGKSSDTNLDNLKLSEFPLLLVLESIEKPGNLGAMIRTADASGVEAIILANPVLDIYNPNTIRASQGAFFDLPIIEADNLEVMAFLEHRKIEPLLTTPKAEQDAWEKDLSGKLAIVLGAEDTGLSEDWLETEYPRAKLPMEGISDSLNVSVACGIFLFEAVRQRNVKS